MSNSVLDMFMEIQGINPNFTDAWGNYAKVSEKNVRNLITKMGFESADDSVLMEYCIEEEKKHWLSPLPAVSIFQENSPYTFDICLPIDFASESFVYKIVLENGDEWNDTISATSFPLVATKNLSDTEYQCYQITLNVELPLGYHDLSLYDPDVDEAYDSMSLIVTPSKCYIPNEIQEGKKIWGSSVQLYGIKSENNWGIGDFNDLKTLLSNINENGGDFVGLNPIHSLFPAQPNNASPYSPSSRKWLNILYTHIPEVDEFTRNIALQEKVASIEFKNELRGLRDAEWVDYEAVTAIKLSSLRLLFDTLNDGSVESNKRLVAFDEYIEKKGESLLTQATYDALQFYFLAEDPESWGWPVWPKEFQAYQSETVQNWISDNLQEVRFWCYTQWVAELQLDEADKLSKSLGMTLGIYRDLAVGSCTGSAALWGSHHLFCEHISIGAPPDVLGPLGQSWGLPPIAPDQFVKNAYQPFIDLLRSNMQYCGALRIDHVMGLLRLWWVPEGESADKGAYVYYQVEDMLNILALESVRNKCLVIGEDLGTIPEGIDVLLKDAGVYSYKVFFFEQAHDGGFIAPDHYQVQAMATLSTHDMPTIKGFWECNDLHLGRQLGLYPVQHVFDELLNHRSFSKQRILDSLHGLGSISSDYTCDASNIGMDQTLNFSLQSHLAKGSSALLSLQLEDFLEMDQPVNVPGTSDEYPNWKRKLSKSIEELFADKNIKALLAELTHARSH